jgi:AcrR family transcriptional regulator
MGGLERRERLRQAKRQEILDAARFLIGESGLAAFTMDRLAERTEMAKGTLYLHFPSRADLLGELVAHWLDGMAGRFGQAAAGAPDPLGALEAIGLAWADYAHATRDLEPLLGQARTRLFQEELTGPARERLAEANARPYAVLAEAVAAAQARGLLSDRVAPLDLALELAAFSMGVLELCTCLEGCALRPEPDSMLRRAWSRLLDPLIIIPTPGEKGPDA